VCAVPLPDIRVFARGVKIYLAERLHSDLIFTDMSVIRLNFDSSGHRLNRQQFVVAGAFNMIFQLKLHIYL